MIDQLLLENFEVIPLEGDAIVRRQPGLLAVLDGDFSDAAVVLRSLDERSRGGLETIEYLRSISSLDIAALIDTPMGVQLLLTGGMHALIDEGDPDESSLEVRTPAGGEVTDLDNAAAVVWIGTSQIRNSLRHAIFDLREGTVPGAGVLVRPITPADPEDSAAPATLIPPPPVESPPVVMPFESVEFSTPAPQRRPSLPVVGTPDIAEEPVAKPAKVKPAEVPIQRDEPRNEVQGIRCSRSHFNNPRAAYCQVCGISMIHLTHRLVPGQRPTLGFIVFDDGATFALDRSYRLGRQPDPAAHVDIIAIVDSEHSLSRHHADLSFDGWDVVLTDRGSTNGTFVWNETASSWDRLAPDSPRVVATGSHVALGRRTFTYESATRS